MNKRRIIITLLIVALSASSVWAVPFDKRVNLHGGKFPTKSMAIWELQRYKETELLRKAPLKWCPYKSYLLVDQYVEVKGYDNRHWLHINADLVKLTIDDARYNKAHAKVYKGSKKKRLKKIFRYCENTEYVMSVKTARDVFEKRQGDCAAITAAFYVLCKKNKIPVRYVIGWAYGECHAWNRVKLKGKWYWVDATMGLWISRKQLNGNRTILEMW